MQTLIDCPPLVSEFADSTMRWDDIARFAANAEPSLAELMADPIFAHLLASDGLKVEHVCETINGYRQRAAAH